MDGFCKNDGGHYGSHDVSACWYRWHEFAKPGKTIGNIMAFGERVCQNVDLVTDDFGNLVGVPS